MLVSNALISSLGSGLFLAGSVIYFVKFVGFSEAQVGVTLSAASLVGFATTVPVGHLGDRLGLRRTLAAIAAYRGVGYMAYLLVSEYWQFTLVACLLYVADRGGPAIQQSLIAGLLPGSKRTWTMGMVRSVRNAGLTIGFLLAGIALQVNSESAYQALFIGNAISFFVSALLIRRLPDPAAHPAAPDEWEDPSHDRPQRPWRDWRFLGLTVVNAPLFLHDTLLLVLLPIWIVGNTDAPPWAVTAMLTLNTILAVALQVRTTRLADTYRKARSALPLSGLVLTVGCGLYAVSGAASAWSSVALLVGGTLLLTASELLHTAAAWQLSFDLSPDRSRTPYLAFFNLSFSAEEIVGPALALSLLGMIGAWSWVAVGAVVLAATAACPVILRGTVADTEPTS